MKRFKRTAAFILSAAMCAASLTLPAFGGSMNASAGGWGQFDFNNGNGFDWSQFGNPGGNNGDNGQWTGWGWGDPGQMPGGNNQQTDTPVNSDPTPAISSGNGLSPKEYMASVKASFTSSVPGDIKNTADGGKLEKITYFSKKANRNKPANVWLPPNYDSSKKYPVLYMNHGVMGGENDMVSGWSIREMATGLIKKGEAPAFIIVFTQMYTDPKSATAGGITQEAMDRYDDFLYDLTESLMPYMAQNYSVAEGRENTAIAGFSMGGRESLFIGIKAADKIGYVCASSPAPGVVPGQDMFLNHRGSMTESEFKFSEPYLPYVLMIGGGTNDSVVGTFPKQYHELFDKNGTDNIWFEVPGAGHDASVGTPLFYNFFRSIFKAGDSSQPATQPSTQPATQAPTQPATQAPTQPVSNAKLGDVNGDGVVNVFDVCLLRSAVINVFAGSFDGDKAASDVDQSGQVDIKDLEYLNKFVMKEISSFPVNKPAENTQQYVQHTTEPATAAPSTPSGNGASPKEYMASVKATFTSSVPGDIKNTADGGKMEKITYFSKKANRNKPANVWLPPNYDSSKKYPVLYMNHGVMGGENDMVSGWGIREMATGLIKKGEAVPFIIVFPQMYTDPKSANAGGITQEAMDRYDDFLYDLTESLMPYMAQNYSVAEGRENTAIAGFSMGGRESLFIGIKAADKIGYICASSPAPGVVPGKDMFLNHRGSMTESEFKFSEPYLPYVLMIGGGTNDSVVGTFPKQYHELFDKNGTDNIWFEVPGAGHDASVGTPLFYNFFRAVFKA